MWYKIIKNKKGATMILLTMLILTSIIAATLASAEIIRTGLIMGRTQVYSTIAFFAAEAGAERILYDVRYGGFDIELASVCTSGYYVVFGSPNTCNANSSTAGVDQELPNHAHFQIRYELDVSINSIKSTGSYNNLQRTIELRY